MAKDYKEWFLQSEYDLNSATKSFDSGDYIYCMFFCHHDAAVSTRYPDSLTKLSEQFDKEFVSNILTETKELLKWLMTEYKK